MLRHESLSFFQCDGQDRIYTILDLTVTTPQNRHSLILYSKYNSLSTFFIHWHSPIYQLLLLVLINVCYSPSHIIYRRLAVIRYKNILLHLIIALHYSGAKTILEYNSLSTFFYVMLWSLENRCPKRQ